MGFKESWKTQPYYIKGGTIGVAISFLDFLLLSITTMFGIDETIRTLNRPILFVAQQLFFLTNCNGEGCLVLGGLIDFSVLIIIGFLIGVLVCFFIERKKNNRK